MSYPVKLSVPRATLKEDVKKHEKSVNSTSKRC